jgi:hypothetical protein
MTRRVWSLTALVAAIALTAGAVPALSADSGAVAVSVTAQAAAAPCLTVSPSSVDFGTLPFSTNNGAGLSKGETDITVNFCGTSTGQNLLGSTTNATGPGGSWTPLAYDGTIHPCPDLNQFYLSIFGFTSFELNMNGTPAPVLASLGGPPAVFPLGDKVFRLSIRMPCQGSNGAGEAKTLTATFTAVVP